MTHQDLLNITYVTSEKDRKISVFIEVPPYITPNDIIDFSYLENSFQIKVNSDKIVKSINIKKHSPELHQNILKSDVKPVNVFFCNKNAEILSNHIVDFINNKTI